MENQDPKTGRFVKGNKASPGRPARHTEASVLEKMWQGDKPDRIVKSVDRMIKLAEGGDVQAFKAVIAYYAGLPIQKLQISSRGASLLAEVLELFKARGISDSEVFEAMIAQLASTPAEVAEGDEYDERD